MMDPDELKRRLAAMLTGAGRIGVGAVNHFRNTAQQGQQSAAAMLPRDERPFMQRLPGLLEMGLDQAPIVGDIKALAYDAPRQFQQGNTGMGLLAMASAIPGVPAMKSLPWKNRADFLGNPKITSNRNASDLRPNMGMNAEVSPEPFMDGRFGIRRLEYDGARYVVEDAGQPIAVYDGETLVVDPKYRRQGIATELVYDLRTRHPEIAPAPTRTRASQAVQRKVWERIVREAGGVP
jgi:hypothetical protein